MNGDQLRKMRMDMGWNQQYLAGALGVTRSRLAHWEQFRAPVPAEVVRAVRRAHMKMKRIVEELEVL